MREPFQLGPWTVTPSQLRIEGPDVDERIERRLMVLLLLLCDQAGDTVSREELFDHVWEGRYVSENSLTNAISYLRRALGDSAGRQQVIETVPKVGYRLLLHPRACDAAGRARPPSRSTPAPHLALLGLLLALLGGAGGLRRAVGPSGSAGDLPEAYVASLGLPGRGEPNRRAIDLLRDARRALPADPRVLAELAFRLYQEAHYGNGGTADIDSSLSLARQAVTLDPDQAEALRQLVVLRTEQGALIDAFRLALGAVRQHPESGAAHFALAYVLRYAGLLPASERECESAWDLGYLSPRLRSCSLTALRLGHFARAREFLELDHGSQWALLVEGLIRLQEQDLEGAATALERLPEDDTYRDLLERCTEIPESPAIGTRLEWLGQRATGERDPESSYLAAAFLAVCGRGEAALEALSSAVSNGYCAVSALESEPPFLRLASSPSHARVLDAAQECRDRFLLSASPLDRGDLVDLGGPDADLPHRRGGREPVLAAAFDRIRD